MNVWIRYSVAVAITLVLAACGGGREDAPAAGSVQTMSAGAAPDMEAQGSWLVRKAKSTPSPLPENLGKVYHVRPDGGSADQCTGLADAAHNGSSRNCAWSSPMVALPPAGGRALIGAGDTLMIHRGDYMIGFGAPGAERCSSSATWDCYMQKVPSGTDAEHPTRIIGEDSDGICRRPPQLWGTQRVEWVVNLKGSNYVEMSCLEITDRSQCAEFHRDPNIACNRTRYPYGDWGKHGIMASDSRNVKLSKLNIHGMANRGILAGRLTDWTVDAVRIARNPWAGWDGDLSSDGTGRGSSNSGTMRFSRWLVEYNGCSETWPGQQPIACWAQTAGGYGDGVGTGETNGNWVIEDSIFRFNTSDGLDLLYHRAGTVIINRVRARGNASNQLKVTGKTTITNSVVMANCGYFDGKPFTYNVDNCRAAGDAVAVVAHGDTDVINLTNNTIVSAGNVAILSRGPTGSVLKLRNNILVGLPKFMSPGEQSADTFLDNWVSPGLRLDEAYSIKQDLRNVVCSTDHTICGNAGLLSVTSDSVNPRLTSTSRAVDSGMRSVSPVDDVYNEPRPSGKGYDRGAVESQ